MPRLLTGPKRSVTYLEQRGQTVLFRWDEDDQVWVIVHLEVVEQPKRRAIGWDKEAQERTERYIRRFSAKFRFSHHDAEDFRIEAIVHIRRQCLRGKIERYCGIWSAIRNFGITRIRKEKRQPRMVEATETVCGEDRFDPDATWHLPEAVDLHEQFPDLLLIARWRSKGRTEEDIAKRLKIDVEEVQPLFEYLQDEAREAYGVIEG